MQYTICLSAVKNVPNAKKYAQLLFHFIMENNPDRVVYNSQILESYKLVQSDIIASWIDLMTNGGHWKSIENLECTSSELFIEACKVSSDKRLIVDEKDFYDTCRYDGISCVLDKYEALVELGTNRNIYINGEGHTFTTGESSGIEINERES